MPSGPREFLSVLDKNEIVSQLRYYEEQPRVFILYRFHLRLVVICVRSVLFIEIQKKQHVEVGTAPLVYTIFLSYTSIFFKNLSEFIETTKNMGILLSDISLNRYPGRPACSSCWSYVRQMKELGESQHNELSCLRADW